MAMNPQKQASKQFVEYWTFNRPGSEKSGCQQYWNMLLGKVLGMTDLESCIRYEVPVQVPAAPSTKHQAPSTKYLDAWIPSTRVLIEQKSRGVKLDAPQPGHDLMTPFEQAKFYDDHRPFDEKARWIVTCNFDEIWIYDQTKPLAEPEKITLGSLPKEYTRLAFLINSEVKKVSKRELEISVQAGKIVGTLYDALLKQYAEPDSPATLKALNKLCVRLVFCFYAEDADIFDKNIFQKLVSATPADKLRRVLLTLFQVLDTPLDKRDKYLEPELAAFPYTNGGLYKNATGDEIPPMTEEIKKLLVSSSDFDWNGINTTIFGALFESTLNPETRRAGGMVYTSSENIHKQIDPLFLNDLEQRFNEIVGGHAGRVTLPRDGDRVMTDGRDARPARPPLTKAQRKSLLELQDYIASLLFLDPASGSGNFLTETYTSLRRLENRIIAAIQGDQPELDLGLRVKVSINQFHGIEINDFAVTVAKTAMWITEAKMARETADILHCEADFLPLKDYDGIVEGNALRMDWSTLLRRTRQVPEARFNYIIGNPPFRGARQMGVEDEDGSAQKADIAALFDGWKNIGNLDYVTCWYKKAADYMIANGRTTRTAFVSTNSICQGDGVAILWKPLFALGVEIDFAWRTFQWNSESFEKAHVHVVIIGFHCKSDEGAGGLSIPDSNRAKVASAPLTDNRLANWFGAVKCGGETKVIFDEDGRPHKVKHINAYLTDAADVFVESIPKPLCAIPLAGIGNKPIDGGHYLFLPEEKEEFLKKEPGAAHLFRPWLGAEELINGKERYCLWLGDCLPTELVKLPECVKRVEAVHDYRLSSKSAGTRKIADKPTRFHVENMPKGNYIAIPEVSSEKRDYVPMAFLTPDVLCSNKLRLIPDASLYHFGVLMSSVHMAWMRAVCGRLETRYDYSINIVYNAFPWPVETEKTELAKSEIEKTAQGILDARQKYAGATYAQMYGKMILFPELRKAHAANDAAVMRAYGFPPDLSEPEIVSRLFDMYEKLTNA